jgi:hypothetical protein
MKIVKNVAKNTFYRFTDTCKRIWNEGIGANIKERKYLKTLLDLTLWGILSWLFIVLAGSMIISIIGISMLLSVFGRSIISTEDSFSNDIVSTFLSIGVYAICGYLFYNFVELAIVAALFIVPVITSEIKRKYYIYNEMMDPKNA